MNSLKSMGLDLTNSSHVKQVEDYMADLLAQDKELEAQQILYEFEELKKETYKVESTSEDIPTRVVVSKIPTKIKKPTSGIVYGYILYIIDELNIDELEILKGNPESKFITWHFIIKGVNYHSGKINHKQEYEIIPSIKKKIVGFYSSYSDAMENLTDFPSEVMWCSSTFYESQVKKMTMPKKIVVLDKFDSKKFEFSDKVLQEMESRVPTQLKKELNINLNLPCEHQFSAWLCNNVLQKKCTSELTSSWIKWPNRHIGVHHICSECKKIYDQLEDELIVLDLLEDNKLKVKIQVKWFDLTPISESMDKFADMWPNGQTQHVTIKKVKTHAMKWNIPYVYLSESWWKARIDYMLESGWIPFHAPKEECLFEECFTHITLYTNKQWKDFWLKHLNGLKKSHLPSSGSIVNCISKLEQYGVKVEILKSKFGYSFKIE